MLFLQVSGSSPHRVIMIYINKFGFNKWNISHQSKSWLNHTKESDSTFWIVYYWQPLSLTPPSFPSAQHLDKMISWGTPSFDTGGELKLSMGTFNLALSGNHHKNSLARLLFLLSQATFWLGWDPPQSFHYVSNKTFHTRCMCCDTSLDIWTKFWVYVVAHPVT